MSKVKNENYIHIGGWMINELHLKGNELLVYACIFGFSQTENQSFTGSLKYLADWANCTKQGILKNLKSLLEKGLITKKEYEKNGVKFCEYRAMEFNGIKHSLTDSIKQSLPNNIEEEIIEKENKKKGQFVSPTYEEVKAYANERGRIDLASKFYEYYSLSNWIDKNGKPVKGWKNKFNTWIMNNPIKQAPNSDYVAGSSGYTLYACDIGEVKL